MSTVNRISGPSTSDVVYKASFNGLDSLTVPGRPIHVDAQGPNIENHCVWYLLGGDKHGHHDVLIVGTGHYFESDGWVHVNSFLEDEGRLVWHAFCKRIS